jgi:hypothetical protein
MILPELKLRYDGSKLLVSTEDSDVTHIEITEGTKNALFAVDKIKAVRLAQWLLMFAEMESK